MGDRESTITVGAEAEAVNQRKNKSVYACSSCHKELTFDSCIYRSTLTITLNGIAEQYELDKY